MELHSQIQPQVDGWPAQNHQDNPVIGELISRFGREMFTLQTSKTGMPVIWLPKSALVDVISFLKKIPKPYNMLYDLHAVDERLRTHREQLVAQDFTVFYHLLSVERNSDVLLKVALSEKSLTLPSITSIFSNANWYEREVWDLFGITFTGHPHLTRIMMPKSWQGHPLRKDFPARAT
ncbi:MAG: NADH-quinone oxidoreductase subunit C, partial [Plesiomonas sp.]